MQADSPLHSIADLKGKKVAFQKGSSSHNLNQERAARKEAEARADQFAKERNDLEAAVGRMEGKIEALTSQVAQLTDRVTQQSDEITRLRTKLGGIA